MSLISFIKNFKIKYPYKYVEPCPNCNSRATGRYIKEPMTESDMEYIELESLKHGEIVRFVSKVPTKNCFCVDCDYRWDYQTYTKYLTKEEIEEEIDSRGTFPAYQELKNEISEKEIMSGNRKKGLF